jgi:hypothetical protein
VAGTGYYGHLTVTPVGVRGVLASDVGLEVQLQVTVDGFAPGVAAMILPKCHVDGAASSVDLGQGDVIIVPLGFSRHEGGDKPFSSLEQARWNLTPTAVQHLERARNGGDMTLHITPEVVILNHGEPIRGEHQAPPDLPRPSVNPHSPLRHLGQEHFTVRAEAWVSLVLTPWQQAAAVTLVVKLPTDSATDDHRTVIRDLADAHQRIDKGDWKGSIRATRDAVEVLRNMYDEHLNPKKTQRTIDEREAAILVAERDLIQALFDYESATHPDPGLRAITWTRERAMLALATATAVAQRIFPEL